MVQNAGYRYHGHGEDLDRLCVMKILYGEFLWSAVLQVVREGERWPARAVILETSILGFTFGIIPRILRSTVAMMNINKLRLSRILLNYRRKLGRKTRDHLSDETLVGAKKKDWWSNNHDTSVQLNEPSCKRWWARRLRSTTVTVIG